MKVKDLIKMLGQCPQDMDVNIAYDSMVCIRDVERGSCFIAARENDECSVGVYLCAMSPESVSYHRKLAKGTKIPPRRRQKEAK